MMSASATYIDRLDPRIFTYIQYGDYADRYPAHTAQAFPDSFYEELRTASRGLFHVFCKAAAVFRDAPDDFARAMDMPEELLPYLRTPNVFGLPTWLARFDYVLDEAGRIRMVEINADTPCFIIESYYANAVAAEYFEKGNPNAGATAQLRVFLSHVWERCVGDADEDAPFVFSCFDDYPEDLATTLFLQRLMQEGHPQADIRFLSFYDMEIDAEGIPLPDDEYTAALYRLHPMEILIDEQTDEDEPLGAMFLDLYKEGKFAMMNPPEAIVLQNKSFMALVHALAAERRFFSPEECALIERYLVPSYFEDDFGALADGAYIRKEIWGREGRNVRVVQKNGGHTRTAVEKYVENYDEIVCRTSRKAMYQDFIRQPQFRHTVDSGTKDGYLTLSCFILLGEPSAVGARFSPEEIAGTEAYFVPLVCTK